LGLNAEFWGCSRGAKHAIEMENTNQMKMTTLWGVMLSAVGVASFTTGCSSDSDPTSSGASGAGGGGAVSAAAGVGGGRPAQGNLTLVVQPATGATCPVPGRTYVIGNPNGPNIVSPGDRLIDGEHDASIACSVLGSGSYTFSGNIRGITGQGDQVAVKMTNGSVSGDTGNVTLTVNTPQLAGNFASTEAGCTVSVIGDNIKPGALWASVNCPTISDPSVPGAACSVGSTSTFVLENCDGS